MAVTETREMLLNVGPAHPAMHGIIRIIASLEGEQIVGADVHIGYLHRGFEKMAETVDYNGVMPYTDRLNYVSPFLNNVGYVMAVEKLIGLQVPDDLSVIGYDDIEAADYVGLTTVRQQLLESGRRGAEILLAEIEARSALPPVALLAPELVVRATTARPKEGRG